MIFRTSLLAVAAATFKLPIQAPVITNLHHAFKHIFGPKRADVYGPNQHPSDHELPESDSSEEESELYELFHTLEQGIDDNDTNSLE